MKDLTDKHFGGASKRKLSEGEKRNNIKWYVIGAIAIVIVILVVLTL